MLVVSETSQIQSTGNHDHERIHRRSKTFFNYTFYFFLFHVTFGFFIGDLVFASISSLQWIHENAFELNRMKSSVKELH